MQVRLGPVGDKGDVEGKEWMRLKGDHMAAGPVILKSGIPREPTPHPPNKDENKAQYTHRLLNSRKHFDIHITNMGKRRGASDLYVPSLTWLRSRMLL